MFADKARVSLPGPFPEEICITWSELGQEQQGCQGQQQELHGGEASWSKWWQSQWPAGEAETLWRKSLRSPGATHRNSLVPRVYSVEPHPPSPQHPFVCWTRRVVRTAKVQGHTAQAFFHQLCTTLSKAPQGGATYTNAISDYHRHWQRTGSGVPRRAKSGQG